MIIDKFEGQYEFLSNFSESLIIYERLFYPTVEHAYQASKTLDFEVREKISKQKTPEQAKKEGKLLNLRPNWEQVKLSIMLTLVRKKFYYSEMRSKKLLETVDAELIEGNWWGDTFWGVCKGKGENNLGKILMQVRNEIKEKQDKKKFEATLEPNTNYLDI